MRKLAIVVALSSTVLATPALARNGAWYVGGDFGGKGDANEVALCYALAKRAGAEKRGE